MTSINNLCKLPLLFIVLSLYELTRSAPVPPTWLTSSYVLANSQKIINNVLTGSSASPSATFTFSTAFAVAPNLGYGISNYQSTYRLTQAMIH